MDIETKKKYAGYIERQNKEIKKIQKYENAKIPEEIIFSDIVGLSNEVKQKLEKGSAKNYCPCTEDSWNNTCCHIFAISPHQKRTKPAKKRIES